MIIEKDIDTAIIPFYDVPNQMIKIIPEADFGIALSTVKKGSSILLSNSEKYIIIDIATPKEVEISNAIMASIVDMDKWLNKVPLRILVKNSLMMFEGLDNKNSLIIWYFAKSSQTISKRKRSEIWDIIIIILFFICFFL